jgi:hypothetical protein
LRLINHKSLASTIDSINEALFYKKSLSKYSAVDVAKWIASRQGMHGSYANMFAPTKKDFQNGLVLFTGEKVSTRAGISHVLGQESCRTLILLRVESVDVELALERASAGFIERMKNIEQNKGTYCCATCSCAFWRHLSVGGLVNSRRILTTGMKTLESLRDGKGRWKKFPFYYMLLVLSEMELPAARKELQYVAPACERVLKRETKKTKISQRRRILAERILEMC